MEEFKVIVKIETSVYWRKSYNSFSKERKVTLLKRKSNGTLRDCFDDLEIDINSIPNFDSLPDGEYQVCVNLCAPCPETGVVDDWDITLKSV